MANVLNEFLSGVSKGFSDAAFASFSRRRSTVREDLAQSFTAASDEEKPDAAAGGAPAGGSAYLDLVNTDASASVSGPSPRAIAAPKRGRGAAKPKEAAVGGAPRGRGRRPKAGGGDSGLKEV
jgi:hypothetical protein